MSNIAIGRAGVSDETPAVPAWRDSRRGIRRLAGGRLALAGLAPERLKLASGLFNLMRNLGGAIGIAGCGTILDDRANLHFLRIAEHLNATNSAMVELLHRVGVTYATALGGDALHGPSRGLAEALVPRLIATAMVPLMRKVVSPKRPPSDAH
jgi:MFS transporter, DHA2 family, multidrug resistance protein